MVGGGGYDMKPCNRSIHRLLTPRSTLPLLSLHSSLRLANETSVVGRRVTLLGWSMEQWRRDGSVRLSETADVRAAVTKAANFPKLRHRCSVVRSFILSSLLLLPLPDRPILPIVGVIVELLLLLVVVTKGGRDGELALARSFQSLGYRSLAKSPH